MLGKDCDDRRRKSTLTENRKGVTLTLDTNICCLHVKLKKNSGEGSHIVLLLMKSYQKKRNYVYV